ncbi:hypothetical protein PRUPE_4G263800 [Prunus persica]|uniref:PpiC domain-containing protein n=1 Tax=Prunus persica TaxID=3760 RepID=A0A251PRI8_PRUPE|nr:hypothetical protein PRUPE_4G263800 [Prunus persica]
MLRVSHLTPIAPPALSALRLSLSPTLNLLSPSNVHKVSTFAHSQTSLSLIFRPSSLHSPSLSVKWVLQRMVGNPCPKGTASFSAESSSGDGREILVQHLLVKEDNLKLLVDLQQRVSGGEDLSDLAAEYSICPSKQEGGMLGWVRKGQMVPEFEEAAFNASLNKVVRCKTKFGWHLLQVLSEREESVLQDIQPEELHVKMQDPSFLDEAQLIDVREPEEVVTMACDHYKLPSGCRPRGLREYSMFLVEFMIMLKGLIQQFQLIEIYETILQNRIIFFFIQQVVSYIFFPLCRPKRQFRC